MSLVEKPLFLNVNTFQVSSCVFFKMDGMCQRLLLGLWTLLFLVLLSHACNDAICASRVSKCQLIKCCECDMSDKKNCSCCHDCQICLSRLYAECCSCVGLCPPPDPNDVPYKSSTIEILLDPIPDLFNVLTIEDDVQKRWSSFRYQVRKDAVSYTMDRLADMETAVALHNNNNMVEMSQKVEMVNCTVAFMADCLSLKKCKTSCKSMGAARYRWFHDFGCCQCVGDTCPGYGLSEPHCLNCPRLDKAEDEKDEESEGEEFVDDVYEYMENVAADDMNSKRTEEGDNLLPEMEDFEGKVEKDVENSKDTETVTMEEAENPEGDNDKYDENLMHTLEKSDQHENPTEV